VSPSAGYGAEPWPHGAEPWPQTHFDAFKLLKPHLVATDSEHFRGFETTIHHQKKKFRQFATFYFLPTFSRKHPVST